MMKTTKNRVRVMVETIVLLSVVYLSCGFVAIPRYSGRLRIGVMLLIAIGSFIILQHKKIKRDGLSSFIKSNRAPISLYVVLVALSAISMIVNKQAIYQYVILWSMMVIGLITCIAIGRDRFESAFVRLMTLLSAFSLVVFALVVICPECLSAFPKYTNVAGLTAIDASLSVAIPTEHLLYPRNFGLFWEPGAFQTFIVIALLFELFGSHENRKPRLHIVALLMVTVFTTVSTSGILAVFLISIAVFLSFIITAIRRKTVSGYKIPLTVLIVMILFLVTLEVLPWHYKYASYGKMATQLKNANWKINSIESVPQMSNSNETVSAGLESPQNSSSIHTESTVMETTPESLVLQDESKSSQVSGENIVTTTPNTGIMSNDIEERSTIAPDEVSTVETATVDTTTAFETGRVSAFVYPIRQFLGSPFFGVGFDRLHNLAQEVGYQYNTFTPVNWLAENGLLFGMLMNLLFAAIVFIYNKEHWLIKLIILLAMFVSIAAEDYTRTGIIYCLVFFGSYPLWSKLSRRTNL